MAAGDFMTPLLHQKSNNDLLSSTTLGERSKISHLIIHQQICKKGLFAGLNLQAMRIAIYCSPFAPQNAVAEQLLGRWLAALTESRPHFQFALLGHIPLPPAALPAHVAAITLPPYSSWPWARWQHGRKLAKWLRQWPADVFITTHPALPLPSGSSRIFLFLHTDWYPTLQQKISRPNAGPVGKNWKKAEQVWVAWPWQQALLQSKIPAPVAAVGAATLPFFQPFQWTEREAAKNELAGGAEYFLYAGPLQQQDLVMELLKALTLFKKRQRSGMQLIVQSTDGPPPANLLQKLSTYKYRHEVQLRPHAAAAHELAKLAAGSYAVVVTPSFAPGWWLLGMLQSQTAIITPHETATTQVLGEAALYVQDWQADVLAEAMMLLYKEEAQRGQLQLRGALQLPQFGGPAMAHAMWLAIEANEKGN